MKLHALALLVLLTSACGPSVQLNLPERFVTLAEDPVGQERYALRATTPDGVVVGVQALEHRVDGSLAFWQEALTRRVRDQQGYALLSDASIEAGSGEVGHLLRFGRDLDGHTYRYTIAVFVTPSRIYLVEAGGREEAYAALEPGIESSIAAMHF